jgi:hypothetical protein
MWDPDGRAPSDVCSADIGKMSNAEASAWLDSFAAGGGQSGCVAGRAKTVAKDVAVFAGGVAVTAVAAAGCAAVAGANPFVTGAAAQTCGGAASRAYGTLVAGGTMKQAAVSAISPKKVVRDAFVGGVTGGLGSMIARSASASASVSAKVVGQGAVGAAGGAVYDATDVLLQGGSWSSALTAASNPTRRGTEFISMAAVGYLGAKRTSNDPTSTPNLTTSPNPGATEAVLVPGAGSGTRAINFKPNAADPNWGLTSQHLNKHLFGSGKNSLSQIDAAGNPDLWRNYIQDLAGRPATSTLKGGIEDIIGTFPKADGSGTFQFGIRISPSSDGSFDLVTLLTKQ